jgi:4-hydroxy-tetrahydrodipicolinate synthase
MAELHAAIVTPTDASGRFDAHAFQTLMRHLASQGLDGVVPCGTTGEGPSFAMAERKRIFEAAVAARGPLSIIAGTGCQSFAETAELTIYALNHGADAALVLPPFFYKQSGELGVLAWYRALCDLLPSTGNIILYHIPPMTGVPITPTIIDGLLASHPQHVFGIKDSAVDATHTAMLCARYPQLRIYTGNAPLLGQAIMDGAAGSILAIANIVPQALRLLSDDPTRQDVQHQVAAVDALVRKVGAVSTIKAILNQRGPVAVGQPLLPQLAHPNMAQALADLHQIGSFTH